VIKYNLEVIDLIESDYLVYYIAAGVVLVGLMLFLILRKPKTKKSAFIVDDLLIGQLLQIIPFSNMKSINSEVSRVKIEVLNLEIVDFDRLKSISNGVFISGKSIKIMFKDSADEIVKAINNKR